MTFDDGDPSQLDVAIPEMAQRGIRGTFFLISHRLTRVEDWKKAIESGQEIGNHSQDHKHARDLTSAEEIDQISGGLKELEESLGASIPTFAYPFTEITPGLRKSAESLHFLCRGGMGSVYMTPDENPDWAYLPSQVAYTATSFGVYQGWAEENLLRGSWSIPQFHAFEGSGKGWQPLSRKTFVYFLDYVAERKKELWTAPLGEIGAYWRSQKLLEETLPQTQGSKLIWTWQKPRLFPPGLF